MHSHPTEPTAPLAQIQQFMQTVLMQHEASDLQHTQTEQLLPHIAAGPRLSAAQQLSIYQRGYFARLLQCMQGQYKALCHALGEPLFSDFARQYLQAHPSRSPTLAVLGQEFPGWLQANRPDAADAEPEPWIDFMVDLARFEWALYALFDAPGAEHRMGTPSDAPQTHLAPTDTPRLQPCLRLCHYRYPVNQYYQQVAAGEDPLHPHPQPTWLALVRSHYKIGIFTLLPAQHHLLLQLEQQRPLPEALQHTAEAFGQGEDLLHRCWHHWQPAWAQAGFFDSP